MRKLLGPHLGGQWTSSLEILRKWQPPLVLVLQPEVDKVTQLRDACPDAIIVGRFFHDDSHYAGNISARPKEFAREMHNEIVGNPVTLLLDYVQSNNEVCQDWEGIQKLNIYTQEWMALADQSQKYKCAILAFSVGNPDLPNKPGDPAGFDGRMLYWQQVLPSLNYAQHNNHILLLHAYGYPDMFHPDADWYIYRYERQVQSNLRMLGISDLKYAYGEIGIDRLIVNGKGGYKVVTNDQDYVNQNLQWERDQQSQSLLLGGAIFTLGDSGGWGTYDIASTNVASLIAEHYVAHADNYKASVGSIEQVETYIPSTHAGQPVALNLPRTIDPRATARGVLIVQPRGIPLIWRVQEIHWLDEQQSQGRHHIYADVLDEQGKRLANVPLMVRWPDGEHRIVTEAKPGEPYSANFPMSASRNEFSITVDGPALSEVVAGIGMGADTPGGFNAGIHTSTAVVFQRVNMSTPPPANGTPKPYVPTAAELLNPPKRGTVVATFLNVRSGPSTEYPVVAQLAHDDTVTVTAQAGKDAKWNQVGADRWVYSGWLRWDEVTEPVEPPTTPQGNALDPLVLEAIVLTESNGQGFENLRLKIRLEAHLLLGPSWGNPAAFVKHFYYDADNILKAYYRRSESDQWIMYHTSQEMEWQAFKFACELDEAAALRCTSYGAGQVMGFNAKRVGYANPKFMFEAFQRGEIPQVMAVVNYCLSDAEMVDAIRRKDWGAIVRKYNGVGLEKIYTPRLIANYKKVGGVV